MKNEIALNNEVSINLPKLIPSKAFIYANSGYGKSWLIRRILEQSFDKIQQIVIDPEGEFSTLREKYDYILIGKGYDIAADPKTAALLAHRLLEEKVSAIIDLYELEPDERDKFVALFSRALVNAPKNLWHPYMYMVDEAQDFAPEKGNTLSSAPLHSIAKKGRKRGCCPIFATQRVSDFSKAVIAACNNKLIGQASLDIDMKRCAGELGFTTREQMLSLRDLEPGEFFAFGPAISKVVQKLKVGPVVTTHPDSSKMGSKIGTKVIAPSAKVLKALASLADLPQEAAEEASTIDALKSELTVLKRRFEALTRIRDSEMRGDHVSGENMQKMETFLNKKWELILRDANEEIARLNKGLANIGSLSTGYQSKIVFKAPENYTKTVFKNVPMSETKRPVPEMSDERKALSKGARTVLTYLHNSYPSWKSKAQCWIAAGYAPGGGFNNIMYELTGAQLVEKDSAGKYASTERHVPDNIEQQFDPSIEKWKPKLSLSARKVFQIYLDFPESYTKQELASRTGYVLGGGFNNTIYELTGKELLIKVGNSYQINPEILDL